MLFSGYSLQQSINYGLAELTRFHLLFQVKVNNWLNGEERPSLDGLSARFGALLPSSVSKALKLPAILANPFNSCNNLSLKVNIQFYPLT